MTYDYGINYSKAPLYIPDTDSYRDTNLSKDKLSNSCPNFQECTFQEGLDLALGKLEEFQGKEKSQLVLETQKALSDFLERYVEENKLQNELEAYLEHKDYLEQVQTYEAILLTGMNQNNQTLVISILNCFKEKNIYLEFRRDELSEYLVEQALEAVQNEQLLKLCTLAILKRHPQDTTHRGVLPFSPKRDHETLSPLLRAALLIKSTELLMDCLNEAFSDFDRNNSSNIYERLNHTTKELRAWVAACLVNIYMNPDRNHNQNTKICLTYLYYAPHETPDDFFIELDSATAHFEDNSKALFVGKLLINVEIYGGEKILDAVFQLITRWSLTENPTLRKSLILLIADDNSHLFKQWLENVQNFPKRENANPIFSLLKEFLDELPKNKYLKVFSLLEFGCNILLSSTFVNFCLSYITRHNLYLTSPCINTSNLLYIGNAPRSAQYLQELTFTINHGSGLTTYLQIPEAVLLMRASKFLEADYSKLTFEQLKLILTFITLPFPGSLPQSISGLAPLYTFAHQSCLVRFKDYAERKILGSKIVQEDIPGLIEIFFSSSLQSRKKLSEILLAQAFLIYPEDPEKAKGIVKALLETDNTIYSSVSLHSVLKHIPEQEKPSGVVNVTISVLNTLQALQPNIQRLSIKYCHLDKHSFKTIKVLFPELYGIEGLEFTWDQKCYRSEITHFNHLSELHFDNVEIKDLKACSHLSPTTLVLNNFVYEDEQLDSLDHKTKSFFSSLQSLTFRPSMRILRNRKPIEKFLKVIIENLKDLRELSLEEINPLGVLPAITENCKKLRSFKAYILLNRQDQFRHSNHFDSSREEYALRIKAFVDFIKENPNLEHLSLDFEFNYQYSKPLKEILDAICTVKELKSLELPDDFRGEESLQTICSICTNLENLSVTASVDEKTALLLSGLKKLQVLQIKLLEFSFYALEQLVAELPNLKSIVLHKQQHHFNNWRKTEQIIGFLNCHNIDVSIITQ